MIVNWKILWGGRDGTGDKRHGTAWRQLGELRGSSDRPVSHAFLPKILLEDLQLLLDGIRPISEIFQVAIDCGGAGLDGLAKVNCTDRNESIESGDSIKQPIDCLPFWPI
jgi:hypothetical protein